MKIAVVVFAKTPGYSKFKTRLALSIGEEATDEFYRSSVAATKSYIKEIQSTLPEVESFFAIAEKDALKDSFWRGQSLLEQGAGSLGQRQANIYSKLIREFSCVLFLGADSPHLNAKFLSKTIKEFFDSSDTFLLGPAVDGGYYLFAGKAHLNEEVWNSVTYSSSNTYLELKANLTSLGNISELSENFDVDDLSSLRMLSKLDKVSLTNEQKDTLELTKKILYSVEIS